MSFDLKDYAKRQKHIRYITISALVIALLSFSTVAFSLVRDSNTQTVLEFLCLMSLLTFAFGLFSSFMAWFEKKFEQYREKIERG